MKKKYLYTKQKDLRKAFKEMIIEVEGVETWREMSATTKRLAFNEWKDELQMNGDISENLRCRACFD